MRVLHIIDSGGMYGAEVMLLNLVREQCSLGIKPVIASIGSKGCAEKAIENEAYRQNIDVHIFRMLPGPNFIGAKQILKYAHENDFDLLHSHGYKGNILFGFIPKKIRRLPIVTTVHGWTCTSKFSKLRIYEWLDAISLRYMDAVVLVNKGMLKHQNIEKQNSSNVYVINNGIALKEKNNLPCDTYPWCTGTGVKIISVGRLSPEKGFANLLEAMSIVVQQGLDVRLTLLGEGGLRDKLERQIVRLELEDRVVMPGFIENASQFFSCFDLLVMPSLTEGLPITLLEAMRAKLPIVASSVGGIPDVLEDGVGGILVQPENVKELAAAITKLVSSSSLCKQLATNSYFVFKQNYSASQMAQEYIKLYLDIL
jgi:glycosyltransferase involved in cell wall biosynthesis